MPVMLKRIYDPPSASDGYRVLVDRLWPRGLTKDSVRLDVWLKEIAPSDELRKWFHERRSQWLAFRDKYIDELTELEKLNAFEKLQDIARTRKSVTLLFSSKDLDHNN